MGSFTGAVPCQRVTQGYKGRLGTDGHRAECIKAEAGLTVTLTDGTGTKVGLSDPPMPYGWHGA